jgi:hypothetical protein
MTPPDLEGARARTLLTACALGAVALAAVAGLLVIGFVSTGGGDDEVVVPRTSTADTRKQAERTAERRADAIGANAPEGRLFARSSFWNQRLSATAALDPSSAALVQALVVEIQRQQAEGTGPGIAIDSSSPLYRVGGEQPGVPVRLDGGVTAGGRALQRAFASVPIPREAKPAAGPDRHMTIWQPTTDKLWELVGARRRAGQWHAQWGGAIRRVSKNPGYYTRAAWPGATENWGATASSLPVIGGTALLDELEAGRIKHALAINLPAPRAGVFAWPAQRTDGTGPPTALPEGARLRLDPQLDVDALALPKLTRMIARAAQRSGLVVRAQTQSAVSLFLENPRQRARDPYRKYFKGRTGQEMLANFPWDRLQLLAMHLCTTAPCAQG